MSLFSSSWSSLVIGELVAMGDGKRQCIQPLRINRQPITVDSPLIGVCTSKPFDSRSSTRGGLA